MNAPTSPPQPKAGSLRLEVALQLLQQSGLALPDTRQSDPAGWLQAVLDGLCELSSRDALTGLANRRQFELAMAREIDRVARAGEPALVLMIDIDHFKRVNDTWGHPTGDQVIRSMAWLLKQRLRSTDVVGRYGGEEFVVMLPSSGLAEARQLLDAIRQDFGCIVHEAADQRFQCSFSAGVAQWAERECADTVLGRADAMLYQAKMGGRNRVADTARQDG